MNTLSNIPTANVIRPQQFYALAKMTRELDEGVKVELQKYAADLDTTCVDLEQEIRSLVQADNAMLIEVRNTTRRKNNPFESSEEEYEDIFKDLRHTADGNNFMRVILDIVQGIHSGYQRMKSTLEGVTTSPIILIGEELTGVPKDLAELQILSVQMQMNEPIISSFINGVQRSEKVTNDVIHLGDYLVNVLSRYHQILLHRHSTEGILVHQDPITTDIAMSIFENVDANGEIKDGKKPDEISAFSLRKAVIIAESIRDGLTGEFLTDPSKLILFIKGHLSNLWGLANSLQTITKGLAEEVRTQLGVKKRPHILSGRELDRVIVALDDLDPQEITFREKTGLLTPEERHDLSFRNETLSRISKMLGDTGCSTNDIIRYILDRKSELREYQLEENSFFVCKIGAGNPFLGDAPGQLSVVPGIKPSVNLDEVLGSGFGEVRDFIKHTLDGAKWFDLFLATSPSKKADKSNVLLVGPMGCGKTQVLRAVASDRRSIGIFAQSSDFLTCWKGESEKNPKRLFEEGLKLQRESRKQVFFLIDEIDTILNGDRGQMAFGGTNLATEFQVLMDGITSYPSLALWGATNNPERIPMPLIRRFSKVVIVGELTQEDRVALLKQFCGYLPISSDFTDSAWEDAAKRLDGAVGDIVRKVVDGIWREKMSKFVSNHPSEAEIALAFLSDTDRFSIGKFTPEKRAKFHKLISPYVQVRPSDLLGSITIHLNNMAIKSEIQTAVSTYTAARKFLSDAVEEEDRSNWAH